MRRRTSLLTLGVLLVTVLPGEAPADPQTGGFAETVDVEVVNVDVFVTDGRGNPIQGLTREEFELLEDGEPVEIEYFRAVGSDAGAAGAESGSSGPGSAEDSGVGGDPPAVSLEGPAAERPAHVIVFVDNANIQPGSRNRVLGRLGAFLEQAVGTGSRVMVVSNEGSPHIRLGFSDRPDEIEAVLEKLEGLSVRGFNRRSERRAILTSIEQLDQSFFQVQADSKAAERREFGGPASQRPGMLESELQAIIGQIRMYAETQYNGVVNTVGALEGFVELLGRLPGRKAIVHVSDGLPMRPGQEMIWALQDSFQDGHRASRARVNIGGGRETRPFSTDVVSEIRRMGSEIATYDATPAYVEMVARANASRVAFYSINGAATTSPLLDAEYSGGEAATFSTGASAFQTVALNTDQEGIRFMADDTGGLALASGAGVEAFLDRLLGDMTSYYSLGFVPEREADGAYHKLKVKLNTKKYSVRHRQGYRHEATVGLGEQVASALVLGFDDNRHGIDLQLTKQIREDDARNAVHLLLRVPIGSLTLVPGPDRHSAGGMVYVVTRGPEGQLSQVREFPFEIEIPNDRLGEARAGRWGIPMVLGLEPGPHQVAVAMRDQTTGAGSVIRTPIEVRDWEGALETAIP